MGGGNVNILALDPATHCGWAHSCGVSGVWDLSIRRDESAGFRLLRLRSYLNEIRQASGIDVCVFESARHANPKMMGAVIVQAELQSVIKVFCETHGIHYRGYSPSEIKKHATGKGNASKGDMILAALNNIVQRKGSSIDDNQADAICLLRLAQSQYAMEG